MSDKACVVHPAVAVPDFLAHELVSKMAYVDPLVARVIRDDRGDLHFHLRRVPSDEELAALHDKVQRSVAFLVATTREPPIKILEDRMDQPVFSADDPTVVLLRDGHVTQTGDGVFSLGPLVASLCRYFEGQLFRLGFAQGGHIYRFPAMIPSGFLEKIQYFKNFPHSLSFVAHLQEDMEIIERFAKETTCFDGTLTVPDHSFAQIQNLLSPTVCHNFYLMLANKTLSRTPMIATAQGNCFRYESINMHSLERLWNFTMWEVIFVGSSQQVKQCLLQAGEAASRMLQQLGFAYRLENANDPFFIREFGTQAGFQQIYDLKYEYRALLPFKNGTLSIGSRNYHMDFFGRSVAITLPDGSPAHSGCIGFGLERLAFAFLAQFGTNPDHWPEPVRIGTLGQGR
ncbi:MAG: hypothetical protein HQL07_10195 [Nitrospirae bacterium]|nr:hypothetical protein [Magnetococcales bacterium]HAT48810.1 hypothetical protein [Alphaproteobacteria bacterium]